MIRIFLAPSSNELNKREIIQSQLLLRSQTNIARVDKEFNSNESISSGIDIPQHVHYLIVFK